MASFPAIAAPGGITEDSYRRQIRTEFENGTVASRAGATRTRRTWQLVWPVMSGTDYALLKSFFSANIGGTFSWTHPVDGGDAITVRFVEDRLAARWVAPGIWNVAVKLEEQ